MKTEENKRMLALSCIIADLKAENMELEQRVHQLVDDYNDVVRQLNGNEKRKDKDSSLLTIDEVLYLRERCDKLERENRELKRFAKAMHAFVKNNSIYMRNGTSCIYKQYNPAVCSTPCLECDSRLGIIQGHGVICEKRLKDSIVGTQAYE